MHLKVFKYLKIIDVMLLSSKELKVAEQTFVVVYKNELLWEILAPGFGSVGLWAARSWVRICQPSQKWHWVVTLAVGSSYQSVKLVPGPDLSWLWGSLCTSENTVQAMMDTRCFLKPMGRVNRNLKQRVLVSLQNGDLSPQKNLKTKL